METAPSSADVIERPAAAPRPGQIEAFDAGWDAHETGIERETVRVLTQGNGMALLAWDIRQALAVLERTDPPRGSTGVCHSSSISDATKTNPGGRG